MIEVENSEPEAEDSIHQNTPESFHQDPEQIKEVLQTSEEIQNAFVHWFETHVLKSIKESPSIDFLKKTMALVGLFDVGLTIAGLQLGVPKEIITLLWTSTFFAPLSEELLFRTRLIPTFATEIAKRVGIRLRPDHARNITNTIFASSHVQNPEMNVSRFFTGAYLNKVSNEKGLAAAIATHALFNASVTGLLYLASIAEKLSPSQTELTRNALLATMWTTAVSVGVVGAKELIEDKQIQETLEKVRAADPSDESLKIAEIKTLSLKLLSYPSTEGSKFISGIELAYITGIIESYQFMHQPEMREKYALEHLRKAVEEASPDSKKTNERVRAATRYVESVLENKLQSPTSNTLPAVQPASA